MIAANDELSVRVMNDYFLSTKNPHETPRSPERLAEWNATTNGQLLTLLTRLDPVDYLIRGGFLGR